MRGRSIKIARGRTVVVVALGAMLSTGPPAAAKGDFPVAAVAGEGSLWIARSNGVVERRSLVHGVLEGTTRAGVGVRDLATAGGRVWALTTVSHRGESAWLRPIAGPGDAGAIPLQGSYCHLAAHGTDVIATGCNGGRMARVDVRTRTVTTLRVLRGRITDSASAGGRLWVALRRPRISGRKSGTAVVAVDPRTGERRSRLVPVGLHGALLAASGNRLWAASGDGRLTAINATSGLVEYRVGLGRRPAGITATDGEAWITVSRLGSRGAILAIAGGRRREVGLGRSGNPLQVAGGGGAIWATGYRFTRRGLQPRLWRIDPASTPLVATPVTPTP